MAEGKKSVLLYCDIIYTVEELEDADAGLLFKHYLRYINDQNPEPPNKLIKIVFEPIKQNLKRDLKKWETKSERNRQTALDSWGKRKDANASERKKRNAKNADKDTVTDKVTVKDKVKDINIVRVRPDENYLLDLPEVKVNAAIEYLSITKKVKADEPLILSLWTVFKEKNFTGEKFYKSNSDIFRHFFETLKFEQINGTHQQFNPGSSKLGTSAARIEAARKF